MNTLSAILWNPDIEIFSIFGISIRYYSVLFVTGLSLVTPLLAIVPAAMPNCSAVMPSEHWRV